MSYVENLKKNYSTLMGTSDQDEMTDQLKRYDIKFTHANVIRDSIK